MKALGALVVALGLVAWPMAVQAETRGQQVSSTKQAAQAKDAEKQAAKAKKEAEKQAAKAKKEAEKQARLAQRHGKKAGKEVNKGLKDIKKKSLGQ